MARCGRSTHCGALASVRRPTAMWRRCDAWPPKQNATRQAEGRWSEQTALLAAVSRKSERGTATTTSAPVPMQIKIARQAAAVSLLSVKSSRRSGRCSSAALATGFATAERVRSAAQRQRSRAPVLLMKHQHIAAHRLRMVAGECSGRAKTPRRRPEEDRLRSDRPDHAPASARRELIILTSLTVDKGAAAAARVARKRRKPSLIMSSLVLGACAARGVAARAAGAKPEGREHCRAGREKQPRKRGQFLRA